ncbi:MAG: DoxX family protein [Tepidisphaeraceae bacterium]
MNPAIEPTAEALDYESKAKTVRVSKAAYWIGWVLSVLPSLLLVFSAVMKLVKPQDVVEGFAHLGWPAHLALALGILELSCTLIYLFPRTAVLGAILLTGYMGGAMATHVRIGEPVFTHVIFGIIIWLGVYLREPRLRALIPLRRA